MKIGNLQTPPPSNPARLTFKDAVPLEKDRIERDLWGVAGTYVLLGPSSTALIRARPGMASDVLFRVRQHLRESEWFTRVVIARDTRQGWNTAEAGYLEGRLHRLCRESPGVEHVDRMDSDHSLQEEERTRLDAKYLPAIVAALRVAGVPLETAT